METNRELYEKLIMISRNSKKREDERRYRILAYCFHPDGYTRERALRTVSDESEKEVLWIAYHRLTDWVEPIRTLAAELIDSRLSIADGDELMRAYPYVVACARSERVLGHFGDRYISLFEDALIRLGLWDSLREILLGSKTEDAYFATRVMMRNEEGCGYLCACFENLTNAVLKGRIFSSLSENCPEHLTRPMGADGETTVLDMMLSDPLPANRLKALLWLHHNASDAKAMEAAMNLLEDPSCVVRGQACIMLASRSPHFDPHAYYAERLKVSPTAGVIHGFAETGKQGDETDLGVIKELLNHAKEGNRITPALLRALHILTPISYPDSLPDLLTSYLGSSLPKVPRTAAHLLMLRGYADHEKVYDVLKSVDTSSNTLWIIRVLGTVGGKWDRLIYLLRALIFYETKGYGWKWSYSQFVAGTLLDRWLATANRSFTSLTPEISLTVEGLLSLCEEKDVLDEGKIKSIRFYLK